MTTTATETKLAIHGGPKTKTTPYGTGKRFGDKELQYLKEALDQGTLFYANAKAQKTKAMVQKFAAMYDMPHATATTSGTAALHVAIAAAQIPAGSEIITSPITDQGTVIGILYQNCIPVFADLHPLTANLDPADIRRRITPKTKAIMPVHLTGNPAPMDEIMAIAREHNLVVIEDCAQAHRAKYHGRWVGTIGDFGCFSLNDFKQIGAGDGGIVLTKDESKWKLAQLYADKCYYRDGSARNPTFLAPCYRMNELTAAVALAQLEKVDWICGKRTKFGNRITEGIQGLPGILPPLIDPKDTSTFWFFLMRVDEKALGATRADFVKALQAEGISAGAGYIATCVYEYEIFAKKQFFPGAPGFPLGSSIHPTQIEYKKGLCPVAEEFLRTCVTLPVNEFFTDQDIEETIAGVRKVATWFAENKGQ
jgi:dTDP-4-amino-4,6-dideoxygalactose transaminase